VALADEIQKLEESISKIADYKEKRDEMEVREGGREGGRERRQGGRKGGREGGKAEAGGTLDSSC